MPTKTATRRAPARTKAAKPKPVADEIEELEEDAPEVVEEEAPKAKRTRKTAAPAKRTKKVVDEEPEEDEDLEDDDEEEEAPAPAKGKKAKAAPAKEAAKPKREEPKYGTKWLAEYLSEQLGKEIKPFDLRAVLRKMANAGDLDREVGATRERYSFGGPKDPVVKNILARLKSGELDKAKKEKLAELKAKKAAKAKAKEEPEEEYEDDVEDLDDEDDEDED